MAESLFAAAFDTVEGFWSKLINDVFGQHGSGGSGVLGIRWEGMTNAQLAQAVSQLGDGPGAAGVTQAADALTSVAQSLQQIDSTLHTQLQAIGVDWQSQASELAQEMTTASAAYSTSAGQAGGTNSGQVGQQGDAYAAAKNGAPNPSTLNGPTQANFFDHIGTPLTGHSTDYAQQAGRTDAARQQTIDTLNNYATTSQTGLSGYHPLPQPPGITVTPSHVDPTIGQTTAVQGYVAPAQGVPAGSGAPAGSVGAPSGVRAGTAGLPGLPGSMPGPGLPGAVPGGGLPGGALPGAPGQPPAPGVPGGGGAGGPGQPTGPGPVSGVGPAMPGVASGSAAGAAGAAGAGSVIDDAAIGAAIVGGTTGAGVAGASARSDRLVRGRDLGEPAFGSEEGDGAHQQAARALAELDEEEAAAAGVNARIGATAEPPPSMLGPAVAARRGEEDAERVSRYAVESEDVFGDGRLVVPSVLGGDAEPTDTDDTARTDGADGAVLDFGPK